MKKTLLITPNFFPKEGGIGSYLGLYLHLPKDKVVVLAPREGEYRDFDRGSGIKTYRSFWVGSLQGFKRVLRHVLLPLEAWRVIKGEGIETVHLANVGTVSITLLIVLKALGIPILSFIHGSELFGPRRLRVRQALDSSAVLIANSRFTRDVLIKSCGMDASKVVVQNPGFDPKFLGMRPEVSDLKKKYGSGGKVTFLTVSRLARRKGHATVLKALSALKKRGFADFKYLIIGRGVQEDVIKETIVKFSLKREVELVGYVENDDLPKFYELCDVFVMVPEELNGDYEGFGIVYLEAGAFGKPVVGSKSGGIPDAVIDEETGFIVEPGNTEELAQVLSRLAEDEGLREKLGRAGFKRARSFTWDKVALRFLGILESRDF